jgi:nucleotide-binding universal stress UspA family protein
LTVVVGARGLGGFKGMVLGSVSQHVIHHAKSAVLVVR